MACIRSRVTTRVHFVWLAKDCAGMWSSRLVRAALCLVAELALVTGVGHADTVSPILQAQVGGARDIDAAGRGSIVLHVHVANADGSPLPLGTGVRALIELGDARL